MLQEFSICFFCPRNEKCLSFAISDSRKRIQRQCDVLDHSSFRKPLPFLFFLSSLKNPKRKTKPENCNKSNHGKAVVDGGPDKEIQIFKMFERCR